MATRPPSELLAFLEQANRLRGHMSAAQQRLQDVEVTGSAAGGAVTVGMTAGGDFPALRLDPDFVRSGPVGELEEAILEALRDGVVQLKRKHEEHMGEMRRIAGTLTEAES
jgi:nucleoid-associated protein EbfC